jgi:hypothetical protein
VAEKQNSIEKLKKQRKATNVSNPVPDSLERGRKS